ncbi:MAG TPA: chemotaxis protein CheX [Bryobacteraceae bacterium]|nr:chemotaxis protein CheX [Bryobacteraceae bacterium]
MPIAFEVDAYQTEIARIVEDVFRTMLRLEAGLTSMLEPAGPGALTAAVQFVGEWKGAVLLQCTTWQACQLASRLMPGLQPTRVDEDVRDALGEITNMVGGNLKPMLPPGVALSMPSVVEGNDYALHICGGNTTKTWSFSSDLGIFSVTLVQVNGRE